MWWLILFIPIILLVLLMFLKVRLCLAYEDDFSVKIKVLLFNITLFPRSVKKPNPKDYSIKALQKKQNKLGKKKTKNSKSQPKEAPEKDKATKIKEILEIIKIILKNVMSPFGRYLKVEIIKMHITVGTDDPAKTALAYGGICQLTSYIVELLSNLTNVDVKKKNSIIVKPDFLESKTDAKINITLSLKVWHGLSLAFKFFMAYIKRNNQKNITENN